jgi:hypothetical protein
MFKLRFWPFKSEDCRDCPEVWKVASSYLDQDGDISEEMIAELTQHLDECPPCDAFVQSLRATIEGLKDLPKETAPERLKEELRKLVNPK